MRNTNDTCIKFCTPEFLMYFLTVLPTVIIFLASYLLYKLSSEKSIYKKLSLGIIATYFCTWLIQYSISVHNVKNLEDRPPLLAAEISNINHLPHELFVQIHPITKKDLEPYKKYFSNIYLYNLEENVYENISDGTQKKEVTENALLFSIRGASSAACFHCSKTIHHMIFGERWPDDWTHPFIGIRQNSNHLRSIDLPRTQSVKRLSNNDSQLTNFLLRSNLMNKQNLESIRYIEHKGNTALRFPPILSHNGWVYAPLQADNVANLCIQGLTEFLNEQMENPDPKIITRVMYDPQ